MLSSKQNLRKVSVSTKKLTKILFYKENFTEI